MTALRDCEGASRSISSSLKRIDGFSEGHFGKKLLWQTIIANNKVLVGRRDPRCNLLKSISPGGGTPKIRPRIYRH